ncbi:MAG: carbon-nitrogen hydrolase family protein [Pseudomonadota bacterium]
MTLRVGLIQLCSSDDPAANLPKTLDLINDAANQGAVFVTTPEVTNCVSTSRTHQQHVLQAEQDDITLAALRQHAQELGVWLLIGSLAIKSDDPDGRFANRSFLVAPDGGVRARYDKIHMFDVAVSDKETYRESAGYRPGEQAVTTDIPGATLGMTICYDMRFPALYRHLAHAGAGVITVPSAFSPVTGAAHWEVLLRARAIETGCFILAPAQAGDHAISRGRPRSTYGHSMVVAPWGEVLIDAGMDPGAYVCDLDLGQIDAARHRVPALTHDRAIA